MKSTRICKIRVLFAHINAEIFKNDVGYFLRDNAFGIFFTRKKRPEHVRALL